MFGYVRPYRPDLRIREEGFYQAVYCGLCKTMGRRYGLLSRLSLRYDVTFLALVRLAAAERAPEPTGERCFVHPFKKRPVLPACPALDFSADASALLVYYKWTDAVADGGGCKSFFLRLLSPYFRRLHKKAAARLPELDATFSAAMERQKQLEAAGETSLDAAAAPTAEMTAALVADLARDEREARIYSRFGYCLGRWIYLVDAADDREKDKKRENYNPFLTGEHDILATLNACTAECAASYALLSDKRYGGLVANVLEEGMPSVSRAVAAGTYHTTRKELHHEGSL